VLWFLLWLILVAGAVGLFAYLGVRLWRQAKALTSELSAASDRLGEISSAMTAAPSPTSRAKLPSQG
jgi:hypothetical protein